MESCIETKKSYIEYIHHKFNDFLNELKEDGFIWDFNLDYVSETGKGRYKLGVTLDDHKRKQLLSMIPESDASYYS